MTAPTTRDPVPRVILVYGLLGLIPFLAPPLVGLFAPRLAGPASMGLALYGALILSFLGGARWGLAVAAPRPGGWTVTLAMLPTLVGLGLMLMPPTAQTERLLGLAAALALHLLWDRRSTGLPSWYPALRTLLTVGAVGGLVAGAALLRA